MKSSWLTGVSLAVSAMSLSVSTLHSLQFTHLGAIKRTDLCFTLKWWAGFHVLSESHHRITSDCLNLQCYFLSGKAMRSLQWRDWRIHFQRAYYPVTTGNEPQFQWISKKMCVSLPGQGHTNSSWRFNRSLVIKTLIYFFVSKQAMLIPSKEAYDVC